MNRLIRLGLPVLALMSACVSPETASGSKGRTPGAESSAERTVGSGRPTFPGPSSGPRPFIPHTRREGNRVVMPISLPDGTSVEVLYPPGLDLAGMGAQPDVSYLWIEDPSARFPLVLIHGLADASYFAGTAPVRISRTPGGHAAELWVSSDSSSIGYLQTHWVVLHLPSWTILAAVFRPHEGAEVARALDAHQTKTGFPVVEARPPVELSAEPGEGGGSTLTLGDADPSPSQVDADEQFRVVMLWMASCQIGGELSPSHKYASRCLRGSLYASIYGDPSFVESAYAGLEARGASPTPP
jgi:hypothetical protein